MRGAFWYFYCYLRGQYRYAEHSGIFIVTFVDSTDTRSILVFLLLPSWTVQIRGAFWYFYCYLRGQCRYAEHSGIFIVTFEHTKYLNLTRFYTVTTPWIKTDNFFLIRTASRRFSKCSKLQFLVLLGYGKLWHSFLPSARVYFWYRIKNFIIFKIIIYKKIYFSKKNRLKILIIKIRLHFLFKKTLLLYQTHFIIFIIP